MSIALHTAPSLRPLARKLLALALAATAGLATAQVGITRWQVGDLPVTLVYPSPEPARLTMLGPFELKVAPDALPQPGPLRLVVMSHGTGGSPLSDHALAARLAQAGFLVAQPQHAGDNHTDTSRAGPPSWRLRPQEVTRVIDALAADPDWGPRLQLDRVGVHGMSAGGVTALALAGAQWRGLDFVRHCQAPFEADPGFCFAGAADPVARSARQANFERARDVPEAFLPVELTAWQGGRGADAADPRPDPRVAAVTLAVPVAAIFSAESLKRVRIPVGVVSAGRDRLLMPAFHSDHVLRHCTSCTSLAHLADAGHFDLLAPWPSAVAEATAARFAQGGSPEPGFQPRERSAAFDRIAAFFVRELRP